MGFGGTDVLLLKEELKKTEAYTAFSRLKTAKNFLVLAP
tara:strand:- start:917 stop:1033 length:117 start_codon:yes stop_codon:yes gene_type:complete